MSSLARRLCLLAALSLLAVACSRPADDAVADENAQEPAITTELAVESTTAVDSPIIDRSTPYYCSEGAERLLNGDGSDGTVADYFEGPWVDIWVEVDQVPRSVGEFKPIAGYMELALDDTARTYFQHRPQLSPDISAPDAASPEQIQHLIPGASVDAPLFIDSPTAQRLGEIELSEGQTLVLGVYWRGSDEAFGVTSVWLFEANGDLVGQVIDCADQFTRELRALHRFLVSEGLTTGTPKDVLLGAPMIVVNFFFFGDDPLEAGKLGQMNGGRLTVDITLTDTAGESGLVCVKQSDESVCVQIESSGGSDFVARVGVNALVDLEFVRVSDEVDVALATGLTVKPALIVAGERPQANSFTVSVAHGVIQIS